MPNTYLKHTVVFKSIWIHTQATDFASRDIASVGYRTYSTWHCTRTQIYLRCAMLLTWCRLSSDAVERFAWTTGSTFIGQTRRRSPPGWSSVFRHHVACHRSPTVKPACRPSPFCLPGHSVSLLFTGAAVRCCWNQNSGRDYYVGNFGLRDMWEKHNYFLV